MSTESKVTAEANAANPLGSHFWLVLSILAIVVAIYVLHVPVPYWVYTFKGNVTAVNGNEICIRPDSDERSFLTDWWFGAKKQHWSEDRGVICGHGATGLATQGTHVSARVTWLTPPGGDKIRVYLFVQ